MDGTWRNVLVTLSGGELIDTVAEFSADATIVFSAITGTRVLGWRRPHRWVATCECRHPVSVARQVDTAWVGGTLMGAQLPLLGIVGVPRVRFTAGRRGRDCCPPAGSSLAVPTGVGDTLVSDRDCRIGLRRRAAVRFRHREFSRVLFAVARSESTAATPAKIPFCEAQTKKDGSAVLFAGNQSCCGRDQTYGCTVAGFATIRLRRIQTRPTRAVPMTAKVEGSGTGAIPYA